MVITGVSLLQSADEVNLESEWPSWAIAKVVHWGSDQYFVLGDNSPNSHDRRSWLDGGAVSAPNLLGKPFLVHVAGGEPVTRAIRGTDWGRVRWNR